VAETTSHRASSNDPPQWDDHSHIDQNLTGQSFGMDKVSAARIKDLKQRALTDETLVVWVAGLGARRYPKVGTGAIIILKASQCERQAAARRKRCLFSCKVVDLRPGTEDE
jgi:hypothetical protein